MNELVRYCYECGSVGPVPESAIDCCPDGSHAVQVPWEVAQQASIGFIVWLAVYESIDKFKGRHRKDRQT